MLFVLFIQYLPVSTDAIAGVTAFDDVASVNKPIRLKALTKGRFFSHGGKLVEFHIDEKHIGTTLSGGDGYAFLKYTPQSKGLKKITLKLADEADEAILLVTDKKDSLLLISVETGLFESALSFKPASGAKDAIDRISKKYKIIYLTSIIGIKQSKKWLDDNKLHESIIFSWTGNDVIEELRDKDINIFAVIGSSDMLDEIENIKKISFKETEGAEVFESWEDLAEALIKK
ncbi:MAG: hypothetical protein JSW20_07055 [Nitrospiraceae bacterium]|nr:MAG: hypothetical protein JSW20_07055 [Nitrospiraceae bacterium]